MDLRLTNLLSSQQCFWIIFCNWVIVFIPFRNLSRSPYNYAVCELSSPFVILLPSNASRIVEMHFLDLFLCLINELADASRFDLSKSLSKMPIDLTTGAGREEIAARVRFHLLNWPRCATSNLVLRLPSACLLRWTWHGPQFEYRWPMPISEMSK